MSERGYWACCDGASYGPFDTREEADAVRSDWGIESWTEPGMCICEHEPHGGECGELVRSILGPPWPCGCEEYCPVTPGTTGERNE